MEDYRRMQEAESATDWSAVGARMRESLSIECLNGFTDACSYPPGQCCHPAHDPMIDEDEDGM